MISVQRDFDQSASGSALVESLHREAVYKHLYIYLEVHHIYDQYLLYKTIPPSSALKSDLGKRK